MIPLAFLAMLLGALGRRVAGGLANQWFGYRVTGDTPARPIYGACIAASVLLAGALWWQAALLVPAVWVGTTTGNFNSMAMGRAQTSFLHDMLGMSAHAALSTILPAALAFWCGAAWPWMLLTMTAAPLYALGWMLSGRTGNPRFPLGLRGGSEIGEALWGGLAGWGLRWLGRRVAIPCA